MIYKRKNILPLFLTMLALCFSLSARAEIYVYTAPDGSIEFTNVPSHQKFKPLYKTKNSLSSKQIAIKNRGSSTEEPVPGFFRHRGEVGMDQLSKELNEYMPFIESASEKYRIPISLIKAVIYAESAWDKNAVSAAGAQGLMQLMPGTAKELGVADSFDPRQNIMGGTLHLRRLANMFNGDVVLMVAAYNAGHNLVNRLKKVPNIPETVDYTRKVLKMYRRFKLEEGSA